MVEKVTVEGVSVGVGDEGNCGGSIPCDLDKENEQLQKELQKLKNENESLRVNLECSEDVVSGQNKALSKLDVKWIET